MSLNNITIKKAYDLLTSKQISAIELTEHYLRRINLIDGSIGSYLSINSEAALKQASAAQKIIDEENNGTLCGIPFSIKDNICIKDTKTTCASKMLEDFTPPYTATAAQNLLNEGAVILGKANMDEFAMGSTTETSYFKKTKNPYDLSRVPGGSSGGSAASVSAGMALGSLGSDTGGSIRQPSAFCGVTGIKPTYGLVSRYGLIAFASSLDQIGPIAGNVEDCALILDAVSSFDKKDSTSLKSPNVKYASCIGMDIKNMKVGVPEEYFSEGLSSVIKDSVLDSLKVFESMGAKVEFISIPSIKFSVPAYYLLSSAEASSNLARYDGIKYGYRSEDSKTYLQLIGKTRAEGFGLEVKRRILLGTYALASGYYDEYYKKALKLRTLIKQDFDKAFDKFDILISPTTPTTAYMSGKTLDDPRSMYLADIYTVAANITGLPAISLPCGYDSDGLPIGLSIIGKPLGEPEIIKAAHAFETTFTKKLPILS